MLDELRLELSAARSRLADYLIANESVQSDAEREYLRCCIGSTRAEIAGLSAEFDSRLWENLTTETVLIDVTLIGGSVMDELIDMKNERDALRSEHARAVSTLDACVVKRLDDKVLDAFEKAFMRKAFCDHRLKVLDAQIRASAGLQIDWLESEIDRRQRTEIENLRGVYLGLSSELQNTRYDKSTQPYRMELEPKVEVARQAFEDASAACESLGAELAQLRRELQAVEVAA